MSARVEPMRFACVVAFASFSFASLVIAQAPPTIPVPMEGQPVPGLERIRVEEKLDRPLPLDLEFTDHRGRTVTLDQYFDGTRPVLLTFAYHSCPTLCSMVLDATVNGVKEVEWTAGDEYRIITISIDPKDTPEIAAAKREEILAKYGRLDGSDAHAWDFLVGDEETIAKAADAAGYRFFFDGNQQQYGHPAAIMLLTPEAKFARYLYGLRFEPSDIRFGLLEASEGRSITTAEHFLLFCYAYDPQEGTYTVMATRIMQVGGALTILLLGGFLGFFWRRERRRSLHERAHPPSSPGDPIPSGHPSSF